MTLLDHGHRVAVRDHRVVLELDGRTAALHPRWLRDQSTEPGQIEPTNRQRLFTPVDLPADLTALDAQLDDDGLVVSFSDGHRARFDLATLACRLGWAEEPEAPPAPVAWSTPPAEVPYVDWRAIAGSTDERDDAVVAFLAGFYRLGYAVLRNVPVEEGTVEQVANHIGYISGNNFGWVFDVRNEPNPTDLAYTAIGLIAHTDEPYRKEPPGIQLLHCLANDAVGGDSTIVDGLAAAEALREHHPEWYAAVVDVDVEYRYDMGTDTVVDVAPMIEIDRRGTFRRMRFNTKLDLPRQRDGADLDDWYAGRRWLAEWLDDPAHRADFRLEAGDVLFMDNHRVLHGRTPFDPTTGRRHLQGCYIEHNGPDTMYRLAVRRTRGARI